MRDLRERRKVETGWLERLYPSLLVGSLVLNAAVCYAVLGVLR